VLTQFARLAAAAIEQTQTLEQLATSERHLEGIGNSIDQMICRPGPTDITITTISVGTNTQVSPRVLPMEKPGMGCFTQTTRIAHGTSGGVASRPVSLDRPRAFSSHQEHLRSRR
jgi:hypothetical protein